MKINVLAAVALFVPAVLCAQEFRGTITGSVTDPQGAMIPNARIVATHTETGVKSGTVSDSSGTYTIPFLAPGVYQITAEAPGFKRFVRERFPLVIGERPVLDTRMEVGDSSQTVTVSAEVPLLEIGTGSVGQVITTEQVEDFPLYGRTPLMLAQLAMGVVATPTGTAVAGSSKPWENSGVAMFSVGGAPSSSNEVLLDGAPDNNWNKQVAYQPPQDAVQEVRVQAFEADAAYGHTGGGTANHITKSGTNSFHGSAYEFNQVSALAATPFFTNKAGLPKPLANYNQYGLSAGGPLWIPKVLDARNKIFWFFAWESVRSLNPATTITTVPTAAERTGDFSALLKLGSNYQIYDPRSGTMSGSQVARQVFANNVIPANRLNPIAQNYMKFYPAPNYSGGADGLNNYATNNPGTRAFDNEFGRLDFALSDRHKLFWAFRNSAFEANSENYFGNIATGYTNFRTNWGTTLDYVHIVNPSTVADVRVNWTRFVQVYVSPNAGFDPGSLGFPSYIAANSQFLGIPVINFSGSTFQPLNTRATTVVNTPGDSFQFFGDVVKLWRGQTLKFGADLREYRMSNFSPGNSSGAYTFGTNWTRGPQGNSAAGPLGQEFASFLLGLPASGSYDLNTHCTVQQRYFALFLQDDWRVKTNLTLNFGIRYEHETPTTERYNRAVNGFDGSAVSPIAAAAIAAYAKSPIPQIPAGQFNVPGGLTFASPSVPQIYRTQSHILSPRFGFAWTPKVLGGKTAIRGGTGVFVYPIGINGGLAVNQQGFSQTTQFQATTNNYLSPADTLSDPFPNGIQQPAGSSLGLGTFLGQSVTFFNPSLRNAYSVRWVFGIQRQLPGNMVLETAYIGNHSVHLPIDSTQLNAVPQAYLSKSPARDQATINLLGSSVPNPFAGLLPGSTSLNGTTVSLSQLLLPFPQFPSGGVTMQQNGAGSSYYESLNARLQKRFSGGLSLITNFVWSKLLERVVYLNAYDPAPAKRASTDSRPLRFVTALTYQLPVGNGKLINLGSGWKNGLLGGWVLNSIYTRQVGAPLSWGNVIYYGGDIHLNPRQVDGPAFDTTKFNTVSAQQLASNIRTFPTTFNNLRADGINTLNASVIKKFHFSERKYLQVRFEAFNILNRPAFAAPNLTPTNSSFGLITSQTITPRTIQMGARLVW